MSAGPAFGDRVRAAFGEHGRLCVGIDPHEQLLADWGLDVSADGVRTFGLRVVEAAEGHCGIVKPQVSFFERFGSAGFAALEEVLAAASGWYCTLKAGMSRARRPSTTWSFSPMWLTSTRP